MLIREPGSFGASGQAQMQESSHWLGWIIFGDELRQKSLRQMNVAWCVRLGKQSHLMV